MVASPAPDVSALPVEALVPHRPPVLLIDRVLSGDADQVRVEATVKDGLFTRDGVLPAYVGVELMAQTIAVWAGLRGRAASSEGGPRLGFLLGTRRLDATVDGFRVGEVLVVEADFDFVSDEGLAVFSCRIVRDGVVCVKANVNVFQPPDAARFLAEARS